MKILILGAAGMAGHVVYWYLSQTNKYDIRNVVHATKLTEDSLLIDVTDREAVITVIETVKPDVIINCIGILIKGSQIHPDNAIYINAYFPHFLKRLADVVGAKLIHISTDCVFSGRQGMYADNDFRDADDIYGRSKALGEIFSDKDLTIRTSIIGPELKRYGEGLFHWFMSQRERVNGYTKVFWSGVTTLELAKAIEYSLDNDVTGLFQLSNGVRISKYDLLVLFNEIFKRKLVIAPLETVQIDKSIKPSSNIAYNVPDYSTMIMDMLHWMKCHRDVYQIYMK